MHGGSGTQDIPEFPGIEAELGYNPARWLHTRSVDGLDTGIGQTPELAVAMSIVKGIDDPAELAYWLQVERKCRNRGHVIKRLEQRRCAIKHGRDGFLELDDQDEAPAESATVTDGGQDT